MIVRIGVATLALGLAMPAVARPSPVLAEAAIRQAEADTADAANVRDLDRLAGHYTLDAVILSPGEDIRGRAAFARHLAPIRSAPIIEVVRTPATITIAAAGDIAYLTGRYRNRYQPSAGARIDIAAGSYTAVYRHEADGAWRICVDIQAPDPHPH